MVTSVFDWDMATIGGPLFDLGALLVSTRSSSFWSLSTDEALHRYSQRSGIDVDNMNRYLAFATWRTAVVAQQLAYRYQSADSADERLKKAGSSITDFATQASELLAHWK